MNADPGGVFIEHRVNKHCKYLHHKDLYCQWDSFNFKQDHAHLLRELRHEDVM